MCKEVKTKVCSKCGVEYPLTREYFHKNTNNKDGFQSCCKECRNSTKSYVPEDLDIYSAKKKCSVCGEEKILADFNRQKAGVLGRRASCRECQNAWNRDYKHSEHGREISRAWKQTPKGIACRKRYQEKCLVNGRGRRYYAENKERFKERAKIYRQTEGAKTLKRISHQRRKALKRQLPATLTAEDWLFVLNEFGNKCCYCGEEVEVLTQDHFIPVAKYGEYVMGNVLPSCQRCNTSKLSHDFFEWYPRQPYYSKLREKKILKFVNQFKIIQQRVLF